MYFAYEYGKGSQIHCHQTSEKLFFHSLPYVYQFYFLFVCLSCLTSPSFKLKLVVFFKKKVYSIENSNIKKSQNMMLNFGILVNKIHL